MGLRSRLGVGAKTQPGVVASLGITFVVLGIVFGDDRLVGYSLIGVGVLLSIVGAVRGLRKE